MPLPTAITDLSTTAASNYPSGSDSPSTLDDVQRAHASFIAQLYQGTVATVVNAASTGGAGLVPTNSTNATNLTGSGTVSATATGGAGLTPTNATNATNLTGSGTVSSTTTGGDSLKPTNLKGGSAGTIPYQSAADTTVQLAAGTSGQFLKSNGAAAPSWGNAPGITLGSSVASTSGTSIDFTGIPSTSNRVTVIWQGVSLSGTANPRLQLGSGSVQTTGYSGAGEFNSGNTANSAGFDVVGNNAGVTYDGAFTLIHKGSNVWICTYILVRSDSIVTRGGGAVTLSGAIDRIRNTTSNGTDTFDAGSINITWE